MTRYILVFTTASLLLGNWAISYSNKAAKVIEQRQADRWEQLAIATDGQCASPAGVGGCRFDSAH